MSVNGYQFENLKDTEVKKIQQLEQDLNQKRDNSVILLAFCKEDKQ